MSPYLACARPQGRTVASQPSLRSHELRQGFFSSTCLPIAAFAFSVLPALFGASRGALGLRHARAGRALREPTRAPPESLETQDATLRQRRRLPQNCRARNEDAVGLARRSQAAPAGAGCCAKRCRARAAMPRSDRPGEMPRGLERKPSSPLIRRTASADGRPKDRGRPPAIVAAGGNERRYCGLPPARQSSSFRAAAVEIRCESNRNR